jgi:hypothetical protein
MSATLPYQPAVYAVVRIPYENVAEADRDDFDDEILDELRQLGSKREGATWHVLDEHGVADWMHKVIKRGLVTGETE